jgi:hypothetical protein
LQRSVLPTSKNTIFESCKTTSLLLFCFRVLFYRINTHALKNAFHLIGWDFDWLGFGQVHLIGWDFVLKFNYSSTA